MKTFEIHGASPICLDRTYTLTADGQLVYLDNRLGLTPGDTLAILKPDEVAAIVVTEEVENAAAEIFCGGTTGDSLIVASFIRNLCHAQQKGGV